VAFCAHTILGRELMEVPDALQDPRFCDNPLVRGAPHLRFYAGVPLVLLSGEALGSLCVLDTQPRTLTEAQRQALRTLARSTLSEIELRRRVGELEREVEARRKAEAHVQHLATRDPLTMLANRTAFHDRLGQHLLHAGRNGEGLAVMFVDLDRFKSINDALGHDVGDRVLIRTAERLGYALRESDTVARLGGDEFALILPGLGDPDKALPLAQKLAARLVEPFIENGHSLHVGASVGIALYPLHGDNADQLLRRADLAMYQSKREGNHAPVVYLEALDSRAEAERELECDLEDAIEHGQFLVFYQPQAALGGGVCGMEALVRWRHPRRGLIGPDAFVPLAEERGLVQGIGRIVLDEALAQLVAWDAEGLRVPRMAVNVSARELRKGFVEQVGAALARAGIEPSRLELEITETALMSDGREVLQMLADLRATGVQIAVDDFGVGYSSLGRLQQLPIDALKIDLCFVDEIDVCPRKRALVQAVVTMADALGLRTIAEGTETASQLRAVEALGCHCAQGYLIGRPMPPGQAGEWLQHFRVLPGA
jgi:diguanylate cyclase (GGDEF)-like protein